MRDGEAALKALAKAAFEMTGFLALNHQDVRTPGVPDMSLTKCGLTSWLEFKRGRPEFDWQGLQKLTCRKLARLGVCYYVVWWSLGKGDVERTLVLDPAQLPNGSASDWTREMFVGLPFSPAVVKQWEGFAMAPLTALMHRIHWVRGEEPSPLGRIDE